MKHLTEEEMMLHYYGEGDEAATRPHLAECRECEMEFQRLKKTLDAVPVPASPERNEEYGREVWQRIRVHLPQKEPRRGWWQFLFNDPKRLVFAGAVAVLVLMSGAFMAGRFWQDRPAGSRPGELAGAPQARQRVVLVAVGDHLERSQMMLLELMNSDASGPVDISGEQAQARELLSANRLYRQSAEHLEDPAVNKVLDDLQRVLVEISNGPSRLDAQDVAQLQKQLHSQGILFEVRVIGSKVRQKERPAQQNAPGQRRT